ncbi:hypothetical protein ACC716_17280 [Rhizobium johnstonii]|uniref:hypothetical protein n=1 Tax=Rhizobium TaxID=379 RepID=UPI001030000F|nr:hypothetical protein [Rhizobium leguminosarum]TBH46097.1 hypothetical protein ELG62_36255 [Rhizobium leguminosarum]
MFSTIEGAKKRAKSLHQFFDASGFLVSLTACQRALAVACGYSDWTDLRKCWGDGRHTRPRANFDMRLGNALPPACRPLIASWLYEDTVSNHWFRFTFPHLLAFVSLHRRHSSSLKIGSGLGQRLRESMVIGLLLNSHGEDREYPYFDPYESSIVFKGTVDSLFHVDRNTRGFDAQLAEVVDGGLLEVRHDGVRVKQPIGTSSVEFVQRSRADKLRSWGILQGEDATSVLADALSYIGVPNSLRVVDALLQQGSKDYIVPSGPVLELMSELARAGSIQVFAKTFSLFSAVWPDSADPVRKAAPAKILNQYFMRARGLSPSQFLAWERNNRDWAERLKNEIDAPNLFTDLVATMENEVALIAA